MPQPGSKFVDTVPQKICGGTAKVVTELLEHVDSYATIGPGFRVAGAKFIEPFHHRGVSFTFLEENYSCLGHGFMFTNEYRIFAMSSRYAQSSLDGGPFLK
jgi:hypothetical protein